MKKNSQYLKDMKRDEFIEFISTSIDDTELDQTLESEFSNVISCMKSQYVFIRDLSTLKIINSYGILSVLGYKEDDFNNLPIYDIVHPDDREIVMEITKEAYEHLLENNETKPLDAQLSITYRAKKVSGEYLHIQHLIAILSISSAGKAMKHINICTDISQLPFSKVTAHLTCNCMKFASNFKVLDSNISEKLSDIFTKREREILHLLYAGKSSSEIANALFISKHTVDKHRTNMLNKTETANSRELLSYVLDRYKELTENS